MEAVSKKYHEGSAMGPVECTCTKDAAGKILSVIRNDNGEEVPDVQQTSLKLPEAKEETSAPALHELSSFDSDGLLRSVDIDSIEHLGGNWEMRMGIAFADIVEGNVFRLVEGTGSFVEIEGHSEFVAMGAPYTNAAGVLVINATVLEETKAPEGEAGQVNSETEPGFKDEDAPEAADAEMAPEQTQEPVAEAVE